MPEYNFNSNARIPFRPLSYDNKDLAEAKEVVVDYVNATVYIVTADKEFINVTASATQILQEVLNKIEQDPSIIGNGSVTLESGEVITIQDAITNINETVSNIDKSVADHETRIKKLENGASSGGGTASITYLQATVSSAGSWTALGDNSAYYQDIVVTGVLSTDRPTVDVVVSESFATASTQLNEFSKIYKITTAVDMIRVYASAALDSDITLQLKIVR